MTIATKPTLEESSKRNPAVAPDRVRKMQEVVKHLQDRGMLQQPRYGLTPPLGGDKPGFPSSQGTRMMNRINQSG